jgi:hypothetical protein
MNVRLLLGINVYLLGVANVSYSFRRDGGNALGDLFIRLTGLGLKLAFRTKTAHKLLSCNKMLQKGF